MTIDFPCNGCIENTKGQIAKKYIKKIEVREAIEKHCDCLNLHNQILPCSACRVKKELGLDGEQK
jgi:hypothetical protein